jgi:hypothetical protein
MPTRPVVLGALNDVTDALTPAEDVFAGRVGVQIVDTGSMNLTITWQGTIDGTNWSTILQAVNITDGVEAATTTAAGIYRLNATGLKAVRGKVTTYVGGSCTSYMSPAIG